MAVIIRGKTTVGSNQLTQFLYVGGSFSGTGYGNLVRYSFSTYAKKYDPTFDIGTGFNNSVRAICVDSNDNVYVGGDFTTCNGSVCNRIVKLNVNGEIDTSFNTGDGFDVGVVNSIAIDDLGDLYVGGDFNRYDGVNASCIIKLKPDGSRDTSFNVGTGFNAEVYDIKIDYDGNIWVGGNFTSYKDDEIIKYITKLYKNGSPYPDFINSTLDGRVRTICLNSVDILNRSVFIGGDFLQYDDGSTTATCYKISSLKSNGYINDANFALGESFCSGCTVYSISQDYQGNIFVGGDFSSYYLNSSPNIVKITNNGAYDSTFNVGTGFDGLIFSTFPVNSSVFTGGRFSDYDGREVYAVTMINNTGLLDKLFDFGIFTNSSTQAVYALNYKKR
jgi:hypothetical protein